VGRWLARGQVALRVKCIRAKHSIAQNWCQQPFRTSAVTRMVITDRAGWYSWRSLSESSHPDCPFGAWTAAGDSTEMGAGPPSRIPVLSLQTIWTRHQSCAGLQSVQSVSLRTSILKHFSACLSRPMAGTGERWERWAADGIGEEERRGNVDVGE